ncbi:MAG: DUF4960 domain-containing protein [Muribaculaceae bacterium]|nr:DUF4960 domain-containing protein [Muribaculaceae bacterium]
MKKIMKYSLSLIAMAMAGIMGSCSDFKPETPELPDLPTVTDLKATVANRVVTVSWNLPSTSLKIEGVNVILNNNQTFSEGGPINSMQFKGQPMQEENMYTVKIRYEGGYVSPGQSVVAAVPYEELADLTSFEVTGLDGRSVTFSWTLPNAAGITGVMVGIDGEDGGQVFDVTTNPNGGTVNGQKTGVDLKFRAKVVYDEAYYSQGVVVNTALPEMEVKAGFLVLGADPSELEDDDELAAAEWFYENYVEKGKGEFIPVADLPNINFDEFGMIWIYQDKIGQNPGWENLPADLISTATLDALKAYGQNGGNLFLAKMATQLTVPLEIVPSDMGPNIFSNGEGGMGDDVWTINPFLGWDFRPGGADPGKQDYYDRSTHAIYAGLEFSDPNGWDILGLPIEGPGWREDHNCMWDCNTWGNGVYNNSVRNFEALTNSMVLATWSHVRDHCVAAIVDFNPNATHGRVLVIGSNAYEFEQQGGNVYQDNVNKLTENIINYLL